jgi:hypothetical protein
MEPGTGSGQEGKNMVHHLTVCVGLKVRGVDGVCLRSAAESLFRVLLVAFATSVGLPRLQEGAAQVRTKHRGPYFVGPYFVGPYFVGRLGRV